MVLGTTSVLVVDDDGSVRELIDLVFAQEPGIYYALAAGGANAISKLAEGPPDVILTDLLMPRVSGQEVVAYARKHYPGIPIIAYSAESLQSARGEAAPSSEPESPDGVERDRIISGEHVYFLRKPFDLTTLVNLVRELSNDRSWRAAASESI